MNKFDPASYPESVPPTLYSGDRWAFRLSELSAVYPPAGYSAKWVIVAQSADGTRHEFAATAIDEVFTFEIAGVDTLPVTPDEYFYKIQIIRTSDSAEVTVDQGYTTVRPSADADGDVRPYTLRVLQAIRATIEGTASNEQASYSVAGRSLSRRSIEELHTLEEDYARKWEFEKAKLDRESGRKADSRKTLIRLDA